MIVTYLVELDIPDATPEELMHTALDIQDTLSDSLDVISVKPWARPSSLPLVSAPAQPSQSPPSLT